MENSSSSVDRISNLPDSIIDHIFSFLPTLDVVGTSILSTRWKDLWTKATTLNFILDDDDEEAGPPEEEEVTQFVRSVNKVSLQITSQRLQKFRLKWWEGCNFDPEYVTIWIGFAITRSVRVLVIDISYSDDITSAWSIHLPGSLFTCGTLEVLKIYAFMEFHVPRVVSLPKLEVLCLKNLCYESNECISRLLGGCPVLHTLKVGTRLADPMRDFRVVSPSLRRVKIRRVYPGGNCFGRVEIDAPGLECLDLDESLEECLVTRLDWVNSVVLDLHVLPRYGYYGAGLISGAYIDRCNSIVKLVESTSRVKFLTLKGTMLKALCYATAPLVTYFERLIKLDVRIECCHWSSLVVLFGRATKLQVLHITKEGCFSSNHKLCWSSPANVPDCLSSTLEKVTFVGFEGLEDEMSLIKYILQHGEVLESFTLKSAVVPEYQLLHLYSFAKTLDTFV